MAPANGTTPVELPHPDRKDLVLTDVLFALSDPARLEIAMQISDGILDMADCHLSNPNVPKSTKSHHMKVLREAGVIRNDPAGRGRLLTLRLQDLDARFPGLMKVILSGKQ